MVNISSYLAERTCSSDSFRVWFDTARGGSSFLHHRMNRRHLDRGGVFDRRGGSDSIQIRRYPQIKYPQDGGLCSSIGNPTVEQNKTEKFRALCVSGRAIAGRPACPAHSSEQVP